MCLDIKKNAKSRIAVEDIICYKRLLYKESSCAQEDLLRSYDNHEFIGIINNVKCEGKIRVEDNRVYFCTNESRLDGCDCVDKLGHDFSWRFDVRIFHIAIKSTNELQTIFECSYITPYRHAEVQMGKIYTSDLGIKQYSQTDAIHQGLHSFVKSRDAKADGPDVIVKCIIPKGAEYYEGIFYDMSAYASNQLKYIEIVKD